MFIGRIGISFVTMDDGSQGDETSDVVSDVAKSVQNRDVIEICERQDVRDVTTNRRKGEKAGGSKLNGDLSKENLQSSTLR